MAPNGGDKARTLIKESWFFPPDIANDLQDVDLPPKVKKEIKAMSFEYARSVIPHYTNWSRYVAFMRIFIIGIISHHPEKPKI